MTPGEFLAGESHTPRDDRNSLRDLSNDTLKLYLSYTFASRQKNFDPKFLKIR